MESKFHVLLIGIDAYARRPLRGCVNDIDAIQKLLQEPGLGFGDVAIKRLASPSRGNGHPATLENIRSALHELATEGVAANDRVFIYYSGHGFRTRLSTPQGTAHREAIVPVDFDEGKLLYDYELNEMLGAIVTRTQQVTVILDCCHSAGVTRDPSSPGMTARCLEPDDIGFELAKNGEAPAGLARGIDACHVVCACLDHERAYEAPDSQGKEHGLLTRALVAQLSALEPSARASVTWVRIWEGVRAAVESGNAVQHAWMIGSPLRRVLSGPPVIGDAGFAVTRHGGAYTVLAGEIAGVTTGAEIGVYAADPPFFPALGAEDDRWRKGTLRITSAAVSSATATAVGAQFELPPGARARLLALGESARLPCAITFSDEALTGELAKSPLLRVADADAAVVRIEPSGDQWAVTDDLHSTTEERPPLFTFTPNVVHAREILEHYATYVLPIQIATRSTDLDKKLQLTMRLVPGPMTPEAAQTVELAVAPTQAPRVYRVAPGTLVAFHVNNTSAIDLRVTLVNSAASGRVQLLGDHVIDAYSAHVFWFGNAIGKPFALSPPMGRSSSVDRVVAIARTAMNRDLTFLRMDRSFADVLNRVRGARDLEPDVTGQTGEQWAAHQIIVEARP